MNTYRMHCSQNTWAALLDWNFDKRLESASGNRWRLGIFRPITARLWRGPSDAAPLRFYKAGLSSHWHISLELVRPALLIRLTSRECVLFGGRSWTGDPREWWSALRRMASGRGTAWLAAKRRCWARSQAQGKSRILTPSRPRLVSAQLTALIQKKKKEISFGEKKKEIN